MLSARPYRRRLLVTVALLSSGILLPWTLTQAAAEFPTIALANLDFTHGLANWQKEANGSNDYPHPFYTIGVDKTVTRNGKPSGYIRSRPNIAQDEDGDGGVLRYDAYAEKYRGKRIRWSAYLRGKDIKKKAFLFVAAQRGMGLDFATSSPVTASDKNWVKRECVADIPRDADFLSFGVRLENGGVVHASGVTLEIVDKTIALSSVRHVKEENEEGPEDKLAKAPQNLDFSRGLAGWRKTAMGSDDTPHSFYSVGVDAGVTRNGKPSGYVQSRANIDRDPAGDGGVLRCDIDATNYRGKRLRWAAFVQGKAIRQKAFLFAAVVGGKSAFATSKPITAGDTGWQERACVIDVPADAVALSLGLRLENAGTAYGNSFRLTEVDPATPLSDSHPLRIDMAPPHNLDFAQGLDGWWNDNPTHDTETNYEMALDPGGGRNGHPAARLKSLVAHPNSYGTIAQNASADAYRGKRIRLSAYLKSANARSGSLWIVVHDATPRNSSGANGESTGKIIQGTTDWTRFEHVIDIPPTTETISFGISSEGPGTVWVDGFQIEVVGKAKE